MDTNDLIPIIFSGIALLISIVSFCIFDFRTKKLDVKIKRYELANYEQDAISRKKACLSISFKAKTKDSFFLIISNNGPVSAKNIKIEDASGDGTILTLCKELFPYEEIIPNDSCIVPLFLLSNTPNKVFFNITWDDESGTEIKEKFPLTFFDL